MISTPAIEKQNAKDIWPRRHCLARVVCEGDKASLSELEGIGTSMVPFYSLLPPSASVLLENKCWSNKLLFVVNHLAHKERLACHNEVAALVAGRGQLRYY